jgi:His-Xaa-Ser system radical SAM maturase HxsB
MALAPQPLLVQYLDLRRRVIVIRSSVLDANGRQVLVSNDLGDYAVLSDTEFDRYRLGDLAALGARGNDLEARSLLPFDNFRHMTELEKSVLNTRKSFALEGPSLHIFVVTLRCDHSCQYCQVSRAAVDAIGFDMSVETAMRAVNLVFESPSTTLTIEFQGGEPGVRFDLVRLVVERAEAVNNCEGRVLNFAMVSTLHHLTDADLDFCREHEIRLSTSIDGDAHVHDRNRPLPGGGAWSRTVDALGRARSILGHDGVSALPTITRLGLKDPKGLVDRYRELGFASVFLRPISPYGFALKTRKAIGYDIGEFLEFYDDALEYILDLNARGEAFEETYAAILLRHILTPFHSGYLDLRSPTGAGLGVLVYDFEGTVYPADEARMAARTGDRRFAMGTVADSFDTLMSSASMKWLMTGGVAEEMHGCRDCAFVPFCGADPVYHATVHGDPAASREGSDFCRKHTHIFRSLFRKIAEADQETMRTFVSWAMRKPREEIVSAGWMDA